MVEFESSRDRFDQGADRIDNLSLERLSALRMPQFDPSSKDLQSKEEIYRIIFEDDDVISFKEQLVKLQELRATHKDSPKAVELLDEVCFELARVNALTHFMPHFL